ncbi:MAG: glycosyltransferase family 4 protein [bacterium]|nr:MAG: glycosyltransferase family 4 protein [bacterium]
MRRNICMLAYTNYTFDARVRREAETLASEGDRNVLFLTLMEGQTPREYRQNGVTIRELNISKYEGDSIFKYLLAYCHFAIRAFFRITSLFLRGSIDVLHVHNMPNFLIFSTIVPFLFGKRIVLDIHDTLIETYESKFANNHFVGRILYYALYLEERISCAVAHKLICVNHTQKDILIGRGIPEEKILVLLNVPDPKIFKPDSRTNSRNGGNNSFNMVYHGTVAARLGVDLAIEAVAALKDHIPGLNFLILGDGERKQDLIRFAEEKEVTDVVQFLPLIPLKRMVEILSDKDLEVISNRKNTATELMLPVKLLECVALGIPAVVPRLRTIERYFSDDMVFYFDPEDRDSLVETIKDAYSNPDRRERTAENAKRFLDRYGWDTHKLDLINLYNHLENRR